MGDVEPIRKTLKQFLQDILYSDESGEENVNIGSKKLDIVVRKLEGFINSGSTSKIHKRNVQIRSLEKRNAELQGVVKYLEAKIEEVES